MTARTIAAARMAALIERSRYFAEARANADTIRNAAAKLAAEIGLEPSHIDTTYGRFPIADVLP